MKITDIAPQKKHKNRFNVYVDQRFSFGIAGELLVFKNLHIGDVITQIEIDKIMLEELGNKGYNWALKYIGYRMRTKKEVEKKLKEKFEKLKLEDEENEQVSKIITEILVKLENLEIISDKKFVESYIEDRKKVKPSGEHRIKRELLQKGVDKELIEKEIERNLKKEDQILLAEKIIEKKAILYQGLSVFEKKKKLTEHLLRRGFNYSTIKEVLADFS